MDSPIRAFGECHVGFGCLCLVKLFCGLLDVHPLGESHEV